MVSENDAPERISTVCAKCSIAFRDPELIARIASCPSRGPEKTLWIGHLACFLTEDHAEMPAGHLQLGVIGSAKATQDCEELRLETNEWANAFDHAKVQGTIQAMEALARMTERRWPLLVAMLRRQSHEASPGLEGIG